MGRDKLQGSGRRVNSISANSKKDFHLEGGTTAKWRTPRPIRQPLGPTTATQPSPWKNSQPSRLATRSTTPSENPHSKRPSRRISPRRSLKNYLNRILRKEMLRLLTKRNGKVSMRLNKMIKYLFWWMITTRVSNSWLSRRASPTSVTQSKPKMATS